MKLFLLVLAAIPVLRADWEAVERISRGHLIEVTTRDGKRARGAFVSATAESVTVQEKSAERSITRREIRQFRAADPGRRLRNGLIGTAVGAGIGLAIGVAVCPYCANEGSGGKYVGPGVAIRAGFGALSFLPLPYRTIYRDNSKN